jgi:hypothetical protein
MAGEAQFWVADRYQFDQDGDPDSFDDVYNYVMVFDLAPTCLGYHGDVQIDGAWHKLWGFATREDALAFYGGSFKDEVLSAAQLKELIDAGCYRPRAFYLTGDDPPEQRR